MLTQRLKLHIHRLLSYMSVLVTSVFYSTTMYKHLNYPHMWMVIELPLSSMKRRRFFIYFFMLIGYENTKLWLPPYKPLWLPVAHQLKWPYCTCSKTNSRNNLSTHLPYGLQTHKTADSWNTTVHHMYAYSDYGLQTHRPTRQLICKKNKQRANRMPVHSGDSHTTTRLSTQAYSCYFSRLILTAIHGYFSRLMFATCQQSYASSYPHLF